MLREQLTKYLNHCQLDGKSELTVDNYRRRLGKFFAWLKNREFCLDSVEEYHQELLDQVKPATIHCELRVLKSFITFLYKRKYIGENWGGEIAMPKLKRKVEFVPTVCQALEAIELGTIPGAGDNKINQERKLEARQALTFILLTGLRQGELQTLKTSDFDLENNEFKVLGKGGSEAKLPFRRQLEDLLREKLKGLDAGESVFNVTQKHLNKCLKRGCKKMGIEEITTHKLRKAFGTDLARKNINPFLISRLLRHTDIKTTYENYIRNNVEDLKIAVNSTQEKPDFMTLKEVAWYFKNEIEGKGLTKAKGFKVVIQESNNQFMFLIKNTD